MLRSQLNDYNSFVLFFYERYQLIHAPSYPWILSLSAGCFYLRAVCPEGVVLMSQEYSGTDSAFMTVSYFAGGVSLGY